MRGRTAGRLGEIGALIFLLGIAVPGPAAFAFQAAEKFQPAQQLEGLKLPEPKPLGDAEMAGLPPGTRVEVLTLERAYTLALVKARAPKGPLAERLDPKALNEQAAKLGAADFARFRDDFLRPPNAPTKPDEAPFHDPSGGVLGVLAQRVAVENAWQRLQGVEQLAAVAREVLGPEPAGGFPRLRLRLEQARQNVSGALKGYRDRLDALKVDLGLAPQAPVVADDSTLATFRKLFDDLDAWQRDPRRSLDDLPKLVNRLAPLESGALDALPDRPRVAPLAAEPARLEPVLRAAVALAVKNRGGQDPDGAIGLQVRRLVRHLVETHAAYETAKFELVSFLLLKDDAFERMVSPPAAEPPRPGPPAEARDIFALDASVHACQARLVSLWASFQTDRLALARELRILPADDWRTFYARFVVPLAASAPPPSKRP